jgi:hypothetical protein
MTGPIEDQVRKASRGEDPATPARVLTGVTLVVGIVAGILIATLVFLWWYLAR